MAVARNRVQYPKRRETAGAARSRSRLTALAVGAAACLVLALVGVSVLTAGDDSAAPATPSPSGVSGAVETAALLRGIPQAGTVLGRPDAPVTLVEFADLQCPYCGDWARDAFPALVREYVRPGDVRLEFRGLAFLGPDSVTALQTVLAAGEQGRLWNVLHLLFENQGRENGGWVTEELLRSVGDAVAGVRTDELLAARRSAAVENGMVSAQQSADLNGIRSTPSFLAGPTGGTLAPLEVSSLGPDDFRARLDELLGR